MCGSTLYCGLEGSRRHSPSRSSTCGVRLGLPSFNWRSLTLPVSVLALVGAVLCDFYMVCLFVGLIRSRIGVCCPITSPGLMYVLTTCYMRKHVSHCFMYVA